MDVAFTTDRRCVSKLFRYLLDDLHAARLGGRCVFQFVERHDRQRGSGPCPKILRGDFVSRNVTQILIYVARIDAMTVAAIVDVLKQFRTRQITASFQYLREFAIANDAPMAYAAFGAKIEFDSATLRFARGDF